MNRKYEKNIANILKTQWACFNPYYWLLLNRSLLSYSKVIHQWWIDQTFVEQYESIHFSIFWYFVDSAFKGLDSLSFHLHRNRWPIWSTYNHHVQLKFWHVFNSSVSISAEKFLLVFPEMLRTNEKKLWPLI